MIMIGLLIIVLAMFSQHTGGGVVGVSVTDAEPELSPDGSKLLSDVKENPAIPTHTFDFFGLGDNRDFTTFELERETDPVSAPKALGGTNFNLNTVADNVDKTWTMAHVENNRFKVTYRGISYIFCKVGNVRLLPAPSGAPEVDIETIDTSNALTSSNGTVYTHFDIQRQGRVTTSQSVSTSADIKKILNMMEYTPSADIRTKVQINHPL